MTIDTNSALVCGGGGVWGVAWMTGIAAGLADAGIDVRAARRFIGTSAGSVVSTQLAKSMDVEQMYQRQTDPALQPVELTAPPEGLATLTRLLEQPWPDDEARLRAVCRLALDSETVTVAERRASIVNRVGLPDERWPADRELLITAVDCGSLALKVFSGADNIPLIDAIAASCAIPAVWPPVPVTGRLYVDGGLWKTFDNAQLAEGMERVLILSPMGLGMSAPGILDEIARLEARGAKVTLVSPDEPSAATLALGALDPACRAPAAEAGRAQGRRIKI